MAVFDNNELNIFGFTIRKKSDSTQELNSFVPKADDTGGIENIVTGSGAAYNSYSIDLDPSGIKKESDLVQRYRELSLVADVDNAISEIVDEFIVNDEDVALSLDFTEKFVEKYSEKTRELIINEFENILSMMNFDLNSQDIFRNWYVDGRLAYHKVIDAKNPKSGIVELRPIDVAKLKRIVEVIKEKDTKTQATIIKGQKEYYIYSDTGFDGDNKTGLKIATDAITYVTSGLYDRLTNMPLSYLHKAIRPMNQVRMMEDSDVIYRMTRAPERRVFYIDTSGMNRTKAEQYIKDVMARYKNKQVYDATTGTLKDDKKHLSILEDFWLPRANGGKGTEITTLPSGGGLGSLENTEYFQTKLWRALNIPLSRMQQGQGTFNLGRGNEITRDEIKFNKFILKLRRRFNLLFLDLLKTQLLLKGIATQEDWDIIKDQLVFKYGKDNFFAELKEIDMWRERMTSVQLADQFVGKYFSKRYIQRTLLRMTDEEIKTMDEQIDEETPDEPVEPEMQDQQNQDQAPQEQDQQEPQNAYDAYDSNTEYGKGEK
jgi:hypothetical protein